VNRKEPVKCLEIVCYFWYEAELYFLGLCVSQRTCEMFENCMLFLAV